MSPGSLLHQDPRSWPNGLIYGRANASPLTLNARDAYEDGAGIVLAKARTREHQQCRVSFCSIYKQLLSSAFPTGGDDSVMYTLGMERTRSDVLKIAA